MLFFSLVQNVETDAHENEKHSVAAENAMFITGPKKPPVPNPYRASSTV